MYTWYVIYRRAPHVGGNVEHTGNGQHERQADIYRRPVIWAVTPIWAVIMIKIGIERTHSPIRNTIWNGLPVLLSYNPYDLSIV